MTSGSDRAARWRLVLGRFAEESLDGCGLNGEQERMDRALDFLYGREYGGRGVLPQGDADRRGGDGDSVLVIPQWIRELRDLFPQEVCDVITGHALERYGLTDLVTDKETLERLEPNMDLLKSVLTFKHLMQGEVLEVARRIVRQVTEDLRRRLETTLRPHWIGHSQRWRRSHTRRLRNLHIARTLRRSLKYVDPREGRLQGADLQFFARARRALTWDLVICVDCSGSMVDSVIYSAVMAGIFHALPALRVKLVAFDTNVVDLSDHVDDAAEILMSVQLGGGTSIGHALEVAETLIDRPTHSIVVLVTDFEEGLEPHVMLAAIKRLVGAGVCVWGLAALDESSHARYDHDLAAACAAAGAEVAALTPGALAEWVAKILH